MRPADFSSYTLEDLIDDPRFILWITMPDESLNAFWAKVQIDHPQLIPVIADATKITLQLRFATDRITTAEEEVLWSRISQEAKLNVQSATPSVKQVAVTANRSSSLTIPLWLRTAAAMLLFGILGLSVFLYLQPGQTVINTAYGETKTVSLPDGSVVTLNANSVLRYAKNWKASAIREVWMEGEAFFKINHLHQSGPVKPGQRFIVHAEKLNVEVLGTTFNVKNRRGRVDVALVNGQVGVEVDGKNDPLLKLFPGELIMFAANEKVIRKKRVSASDYTSWQKGELHFNKTPLSDIFTLIEDNYGYQVIAKDARTGSRQLSGTFSLSSEDAFFRALSISLGISFQKNKATNQLVIK